MMSSPAHEPLRAVCGDEQRSEDHEGFSFCSQRLRRSVRDHRHDLRHDALAS